MLSQTTFNTFESVTGRLKHSQRGRWRPNGGYFHKNKLFNDKPILRFGGAHFVFIFVVLLLSFTLSKKCRGRRHSTVNNEGSVQIVVVFTIKDISNLMVGVFDD